MGTWQDLLDRPAADSHFVQLYHWDEPLVCNVGRYISAGLRRGASHLVVASAAHLHRFAEKIAAFGVDYQVAIAAGRIVPLDACEMLDRFMLDGAPDWSKFESAIGSAIDRLRESQPASISAYGEMVGVLWSRGQYEAAIMLECFWNRLLKKSDFALFCSYPIDVFGADFHMASVDMLLCAHTQLLPSGDTSAMIRAINRALEESYGTQAESLRSIMRPNFRPAWALMPKAEAAILWIRKNLPERAEQILHQARHHYLSTQARAA